MYTMWYTRIQACYRQAWPLRVPLSSIEFVDWPPVRQSDRTVQPAAIIYEVPPNTIVPIPLWSDSSLVWFLFGIFFQLSGPIPLRFLGRVDFTACCRCSVMILTLVLFFRNWKWKGWDFKSGKYAHECRVERVIWVIRGTGCCSPG